MTSFATFHALINFRSEKITRAVCGNFIAFCLPMFSLMCYFIDSRKQFDGYFADKLDIRKVVLFSPIMVAVYCTRLSLVFIFQKRGTNVRTIFFLTQFQP